LIEKFKPKMTIYLKKGGPESSPEVGFNFPPNAWAPTVGARSSLFNEHLESGLDFGAWFLMTLNFQNSETMSGTKTKQT